MLPFRSLAAFAFALLTSACATQPISLQEVRDFADASTKLAGYTEMSSRFRDTYAREQPYLSPAADRLARENDAKRRAVYEDFVAAQRAVVLYMQTLSVLAGDGRYDLTPQLDTLAAAIRTNPDVGLEQKHLVAYTGLARLLTRVIASGYQGRSVETMVRDGDQPLQALLDGMTTIMRYYIKTNENEKKSVLGIFDVEIPMATKPADRMLVTLAKVHYMNKATEYKLVDRRYDLALDGLKKVSEGHKTLRANLGNLNRDEVRVTLQAYIRDLRLIREGLVGDSY
ncbi:hypothetical protein E4L96_17280 [Massilia arenosa]|uniref:Lipoprotein n=1 Tax=Zemynaea arenosa TaxID=2561931 RepID=A0A4Y9S3T3_9BURK|nr:hypothetical protein [Massilia arenosa]TFW16019.1 hypothetical protein E4L96_17280 [Massilia arenosa]